MYITSFGEDIELTGRSGERYSGKIFAEKNSNVSCDGAAIVCLTNSSYENGTWHHRFNAVFDTDNAASEISRFTERDDISHLILIPHQNVPDNVPDKVDDLIRQYIHS
jgi:hypothetical protein